MENTTQTEPAAAPATTIEAPPTPTTSPWANVTLTEPQLKGPCSPLVRIEKFEPALKQDGTMYGWSFDVTLAEPVPDDAGGMLPIGHQFRYLKVFTVPSDKVPKGRTDARAANIICALNNIPVGKSKADNDRAMAALLALPVQQQLPTATDTTVADYQQWVGTVVRATLKPSVGRDGAAQVDLQGLAAAGNGAPAPTPY